MIPLASVEFSSCLLTGASDFNVTLSLVAQQSTISIFSLPPKPSIIVLARSVVSTVSVVVSASLPGVLKLNLLIKNLKII